MNNKQQSHKEDDPKGESCWFYSDGDRIVHSYCSGEYRCCRDGCCKLSNPNQWLLVLGVFSLGVVIIFLICYYSGCCKDNATRSPPQVGDRQPGIQLLDIHDKKPCLVGPPSYEEAVVAPAVPKMC